MFAGYIWLKCCWFICIIGIGSSVNKSLGKYLYLGYVSRMNLSPKAIKLQESLNVWLITIAILSKPFFFFVLRFSYIRKKEKITLSGIQNRQYSYIHSFSRWLLSTNFNTLVTMRDTEMSKKMHLSSESHIIKEMKYMCEQLKD